MRFGCFYLGLIVALRGGFYNLQETKKNLEIEDYRMCKKLINLGILHGILCRAPRSMHLTEF